MHHPDVKYVGKMNKTKLN